MTVQRAMEMLSFSSSMSAVILPILQAFKICQYHPGKEMLQGRGLVKTEKRCRKLQNAKTMGFALELEDEG